MTCYVVCTYNDYRKEVEFSVNRVFTRLDDALTYAKSVSLDDGSRSKYVVACNSDGKLAQYDAQLKDGGAYERVAVVESPLI